MLSIFHTAKARAEAPSREAHYQLEATLDTQKHSVKGSGTITWINSSTKPCTELFFHLYLNAFKDTSSLFLRSPFLRGRSGLGASGWGSIRVHKLLAREWQGRDLWPGRDRHSPSDPHDETDIRIPLPEPLAPGARLTLDIQWTSQLPPIIERTGHAKGFYMVAQWFPKLARLEDDGTWQHFSFHPHSEFYADFSDYEVTLNVPSDLVVGATGSLRATLSQGGRKSLRFVASRVHDFAWSAWREFEEAAQTLSGVRVRLLYPPGHETNAEASFRAISSALPHFIERYGPYPYPTLTVVHPPTHAAQAGGMEYPTLITTGGPWYAEHLGLKSTTQVTVHELAHQWFYGIVASNEHTWPFLDEGLTSYAEGVALERTLGAGSFFQLGTTSLSIVELRRAIAGVYSHAEPVAQPAANFHSFESLGALAYARTEAILQTLGKVYGESKLERALALYSRRWRFAHPGPEDFIAAIRQELGSDAAFNLRRALFERGWVDYQVASVHSQREEAGQHGRPSKPGKGHHLGRVVVRRHGSLSFPVQIQLITADGSIQRHSWDGKGSWKSFEHRGASPLVGAIVDRDRKVSLDQNLLNNAYSLRPRSSLRTSTRGAYWAQLILSWLGP